MAGSHVGLENNIRKIVYIMLFMVEISRECVNP